MSQSEKNQQNIGNLTKKTVNPIFISLLPTIGLVLGISMWLIDAAIDVYFIHPEERFWESVFSEEISEIWMRTLVAIVLTLSSVVIQFFMRKQYKFEEKLIKHQDELESIVEDRTKELQYLAHHDPLTRIYNRRKFQQVMEREIERSIRYKHPVSLMLFDIDFFKKFNDEYGHDAGDSILESIADVLRKNLRSSDSYARWGGEEFIILLPHTTSTDAKNSAEKLKNAIRNIKTEDNTTNVTASFGITQLNNGDDVLPIIKRADEAMYEAKNSGRNCVRIKT